MNPELFLLQNMYPNQNHSCATFKVSDCSTAVCTLVEAGFSDEAFGLTHTLIDIYFIVRYISNKNTKVRGQRFAGFLLKNQESWTIARGAALSLGRVEQNDEEEFCSSCCVASLVGQTTAAGFRAAVGGSSR